MKTLVLTLLLTLSTSAVAGFTGNTTQNGGFISSQPATISVTQALKTPDNTMIALEGYILRQIGRDDYVFSDGTAEIKIEIDKHVWNGLTISPNDKIQIYGKLDNEIFEKAEVEVIRLEKAR